MVEIRDKQSNNNKRKLMYSLLGYSWIHEISSSVILYFVHQLFIPFLGNQIKNTRRENLFPYWDFLSSNELSRANN